METFAPQDRLQQIQETNVHITMAHTILGGWDKGCPIRCRGNMEASHGTRYPPKMQCHSMPFHLKQKKKPAQTLGSMYYLYIYTIHLPP